MGTLHFRAVVAEIGLPDDELRDWIARGWISPAGETPDWVFDEAAVARVRLVRDLRRDAGIETDTLPLVLSLLDQVHGLRRALTAVLHAVQGESEPVRANLLVRLRDEIDRLSR